MNLAGYVGAYLGETKTKRQALADAVGCSLVTFNRKVNGERELTISEARKLAAAMGTSVDEICRIAP